MNLYTSPQIKELTEILAGFSVSRASTKAKATARLTDALGEFGINPRDLPAFDFDLAKRFLIEAKDAASNTAKDLDKAIAEIKPQTKVEAAAAAVEPGAGGPGLKRLRNHPDYKTITEKTIAESDAAKAGKNPFDKSKAAKAPKEAAKPKVARGKFGPDDLISVVQDNPKRPNTKAHAIFACYGSGTKVSAFIACVVKAGYTEADARANLAWDARKEFIAVKGA